MMENPIILAVGFLVVAILIAVPLSKLISRGMLESWRQLVETYPGARTEIEWENRRRFTSAMLIGGQLPLRFNNMLQLFSNSEHLGLSTTLFDSPEVVISKSDVELYTDQTIAIFTKIEIKLHQSHISILFLGRSGRFVRNWWETNEKG